MPNRRKNSGPIAGNLETGARRYAWLQVEARHTEETLRLAIARLTGKIVDSKLNDIARPVLQSCEDALRRALARERGKSRCGHRSYDANRHIALHQALRSLAGLLGGPAE